MLRPIFLLSTLILGACGPEFQTTSGAGYLATSGIEDRNIAARAAYEPDLDFPARIGVVRLVYGRISAAPAEERELLGSIADDTLGTIVHLGPLEAQLAGMRARQTDQASIRQLAASRHLDYVLVIALNPGRNSAEALFLDVGNGYPYASIEAIGTGRSRTNFWGGQIRNQTRLDAANLRLARHLAPNLAEMLSGLALMAE